MGEETAMDGWEKDDGRRERKKVETSDGAVDKGGWDEAPVLPQRSRPR